jgi:hypothetical protein
MTLIRQVGILAYAIFLLGLIWIVSPIHRATGFVVRVIDKQNAKVHRKSL